MLKQLKYVTLAVGVAIVLVSCGSKSQNEGSESTEVQKEPVCTYTYMPDSTSLTWTAYKFTKRAGVSGTFNQISVTNTSTSESPTDVLVGAEFSITTASVNSGNAERDPKLVAFFFEKLANTQNITGKINSIKDNEAVVSITMNDKTVDVVGKISVEGNKVSLTTQVDMTDFEGLDAIASLNKVCSDKHTDEDGVSKLWPDVAIVVSTVLTKNCQ